jgi:NADH-quinone oxidoreductase subunit C
VTPDEVALRLVEVLGPEATSTVEYGTATVDVPVTHWVKAAETAVADEAISATYFDWLSAVDGLDEGFSVLVHLWSLTHRHHVLLRTHVPRDAATLPTLTGVFAGAAWHERETHEMFGISFDGHPGLVPLLLPEGFEGHPLRKEFVLVSRVVKPWPGAKEPGEAGEGADGSAGRRRIMPPGVPEPGTWGPEAGS